MKHFYFTEKHNIEAKPGKPQSAKTQHNYLTIPQRGLVLIQMT